MKNSGLCHVRFTAKVARGGSVVSVLLPSEGKLVVFKLSKKGIVHDNVTGSNRWN